MWLLAISLNGFTGKDQLKVWFCQKNWDDVTTAAAESCHAIANAVILQSMIMSKLDHYLPEKTVKFSSDNQPCFTPELKELDKRRKYEYRRYRRSFQWKTLNRKFKDKVSTTKASYYKNRIEDMREGKPG